MKLLLSALAVIAASAALGTPAQAQNYPWCALYNGGGAGGGTNCGFVSFAQCMATARRRRILHHEYAISAAAGSAPATAPSILTSPSLAGRQRGCGELQSFRAGRDVEHDAAPPAVESL